MIERKGNDNREDGSRTTERNKNDREDKKGQWTMVQLYRMY